MSPAAPSAITVDEIVVADTPESWTAAGFSVDDDGVCRIGTVRVRLIGRDEGKRIRRWSLRGLAPGALDAEGGLDGLDTAVSDREPAVPAEHPNGVELIDHVVLVTPNQQRTITAIEALGLPAKRTRETDTYGAPFLQTFFRCGEVILELIGPEEPSGDGPAAFFGIAYAVTDLDALAALLGDALGPIKEAVQPGRRIATLRHKQVDMSVATAFMSPGADALASG